jgi:hypothetical protein
MYEGLACHQISSYRNSKLSNSCRTHRLWRVWFVFAILLVYRVFFQTGTSLTITILVDYLLFYVPLRILFSLFNLCRWKTTNFSPRFGVFEQGGIFISHTCCDTRPQFFGCFFGGRGGGLVSFEGPTHSVASCDAQGYVEDLL